ncbi:MAG: EamA family transporter [Dysgonomonas sp.]|jgi:undecaprenyl phosphate-alpha-L-ara4N flippase subunit ArnF|nr:EamA family transporter [Prevotella sp.]
MRYLYIFATILFTVYGQIVLKWRIKNLEFVLPESGLMTKIASLFRLILDPFILSGFLSAFVASLFWLGAMSKFEITQAYPFMSLAPVLVFILGVGILGEPLTIGKVVGLVLIILGIIVTVKL